MVFKIRDLIVKIQMLPQKNQPTTCYKRGRNNDRDDIGIDEKLLIIQVSRVPDLTDEFVINDRYEFPLYLIFFFRMKIRATVRMKRYLRAAPVFALKIVIEKFTRLFSLNGSITEKLKLTQQLPSTHQPWSCRYRQEIPQHECHIRA